MKTVYLALILLAAPAAFAQQHAHSHARRQAEVAQRGAAVMPFDLAATLHVFTETPEGGVQKVLARDPNDAGQVRLIREHLRDIRARFLSGDFSAPAQIHGMDMPGLAALGSAKPGSLAIAYRDIPAGAQLEYSTRDPQLVTAIHQWFGAQLADHGKDAMAGHMHEHH